MNTESRSISKYKQAPFNVLFDRLVDAKGSKNKAAVFCGINSTTINKFIEDNLITVRTAKKILAAYNRLTSE